MLKRFHSLCFIVISCLGFAGCRHEEPNVIYMPDMVYSPALKAQKEGAMRMPVQGAIPRNYEPYHYPKTQNGSEAAGRELKNPLQPTENVLKRGQHIFNTYCFVCHGPAGEGDGPIATKFGRPPSLQSDKVRNWKDGNIYHVITLGQNLMPSYASQITAGDRWATIQYIRALQKSKHPTANDLKIANQESK